MRSPPLGHCSRQFRGAASGQPGPRRRPLAGAGVVHGAATPVPLAVPVLAASLSTQARSQGGALETSQPLVFSGETSFPRNIWASQLGEGCYWHLVGKGWECTGQPPTAKNDPAQMSSAGAEEPWGRPGSRLPLGRRAFEVPIGEMLTKVRRVFNAMPEARLVA